MSPHPQPQAALPQPWGVWQLGTQPWAGARNIPDVCRPGCVYTVPDPPMASSDSTARHHVGVADPLSPIADACSWCSCAVCLRPCELAMPCGVLCVVCGVSSESPNSRGRASPWCLLQRGLHVHGGSGACDG